MKRPVMLITGIIFLLIVSYGIWHTSAVVPPCRAAEAYIRTLAAGDVETALKYSSGNAAYAASRLKDSHVTAQVDCISCSVASLGWGWARVIATVELTLRDGSADVGWYSLDVVKASQDWKVVSFQENGPELSGTSICVNSANMEAAKQVFESYLAELAAGDWQASAKYLIGPARRSQEMGAAILGKGAVIGKVEALRAIPVWEKGKEIMVRFGYKVKNRDVSVIVELYRTGQGWKITRVLQQ